MAMQSLSAQKPPPASTYVIVLGCSGNPVSAPTAITFQKLRYPGASGTLL